MPVQEVTPAQQPQAQEPEAREGNNQPSSQPVVGIIYPPPEVRSILFPSSVLLSFIRLFRRNYDEQTR